VVDSPGDQAIESSGQGKDTVQSIVSFTLGSEVENLTLTGSGAVDGTGNILANIIIGNGAANRLGGGAGIDTLTGGAGPDIFVFGAAIAAANADSITDFDPATDTIELDIAVFSLLRPGALSAKAFGSGTKKPATDKKLVYYQEKTGELFYDANGKKQKGKGDVLIATLEGAPDLTKADMIVA
jgi:serralysin